MKVLALDISTKSTGWFITKRSCGLIEPSSELSFPEKLSFFRQHVLALLKKYKPDIVVLEDTYLRFNPSTLKKLSQFAGVAMETCNSMNTEVRVITATQARKNCCGEQPKGFKKREVFNYFVQKENFDEVCNRLFNRDCSFEEDNDITDAAALARAVRVILKRNNA